MLYEVITPHKENRNVLGVLFMSSLFKNRAPEGGALLTIFIGGVRNDGLCDLSDDEILHLLETEITDLMKIPHYNPSLIRLKRYAHRITSYNVCYTKLLRKKRMVRLLGNPKRYSLPTSERR